MPLFRSQRYDRAGLLEQLTGTEIYGAISQQVYDTQKEQRHTLQNPCSRAEGLQLLSAGSTQRETQSQFAEAEAAAGCCAEKAARVSSVRATTMAQ